MATDGIVRIEDLERRIRRPGARSRNMKMLIFGPIGAGKTTLAMTAPNPFLISVEPDGDDSTEGSFDDERVLDVHNWREIEAAYEMVYQPSFRKRFDTIILDSLTEAEMMCLWEVVAPGEPERGKLISDRSRNKITEPQWGTIGRHVSEMILNFLRLADSYNVILIAQERLVRINKEDDQLRAPDLRPSSLGPATRRISVIAHLEAVPDLEVDFDGKVESYKFKNRLTVIPTPGYAGKDRTSGKWLPPERKLPPVMMNPNLTKIIRRYRGESSRKSTGNSGGELDTTAAS